MTLIREKKIMSIKVVYEDGSTESFFIPKNQGFYRERYDYETVGQKVKAILDIHEIFWTYSTAQTELTKGTENASRST